MAEQVSLNIGDIIERDGPSGTSTAVVMALFPSVGTADIIDESRIGFVGTLKGPVKVIGQMAIERIVELHNSQFDNLLDETMQQRVLELLLEQQSQGPRLYP